MKVLVVGAGLAGCTAARLLADKGHKVTVFEQTPDVGGMCYDSKNEKTGQWIQAHGAHIFHTNNDDVFSFISRFTVLNDYKHKVVAIDDDDVEFNMPINILTFQKLYGIKHIDQYHATALRNLSRDPGSDNPIVRRMGSIVYEKFFKHYTAKQWGRHKDSVLDEVGNRLPFRLDYSDQYFLDKHQGIPINGYTSMIRNMIKHSNISLGTEVIFGKGCKVGSKYDLVIHTGSIDQYYDYAFGPLPYRSLRFHYCHVADVPGYSLKSPVVNNIGKRLEWTRRIEYKQLYQSDHAGTVITTETPCEFEEGKGLVRFYPVPRGMASSKYMKYLAMHESQDTNIRFTGRLGSYRYLNMDEVILQSMQLVDQLT